MHQAVWLARPGSRPVGLGAGRDGRNAPRAGPQPRVQAPRDQPSSSSKLAAMARFRLRSRSQVVERCQALRTDVSAALARLPSRDPAVVDAIWRGEALGTL